MTPERLRQVAELYHAARENRGVLANADPELRSEVESLLAHEGAQLPDLKGDVPQAGSKQSPLEAVLPGDNASNLTETRTEFQSGQEFGPYRITAKIGQGGMGAIFRAHDPRLRRDVAIKLIRARFTDRFEREARAIAALNHPHICTLHDVGPNYLVMELLEGETLAARLRKGPLPVTEAARLGAQIADALAEAHTRGITHRDLKPANVMLTGKGVKVLDFGLATSAGGDDSLTQTGAVMGTPAYMAPEQRKGESADERTDIYALGLILCEMTTGKRQDVRPGEPILGIPEPLAPVIERCLAPEPSHRWQSAADVKAVLEWSSTRQAATQSAPPSKRFLLPIAAAVSVVVLLAGVIAWKLLSDRPAAQNVSLNVSILPPPATSFRYARNGEGGFAISPDGTMLAFVGRTQGKAQLWVRRLNEAQSRVVPDSENAFAPFWKPDSRSVGFFTPLKLKKTEIASGTTTDLCNVSPLPPFGAWGARDVIVFGGGRELYRISDLGGSPVVLPGPEGQEPAFLPDGRRFIYRGTYQSQDLWLASLDADPKPRRLGVAGLRPVYSTGHLLYFSNNGIIMARPFDVDRGQFAGEAFPLNAPLDVRVFLGQLLAEFSANARGTLVYPPQPNSLDELRWRDRNGRVLGLLGAPGEYYSPRISPDGRRVAFMRRDGNSSDIWVAQADGKSIARFTFATGIDEHPVWSPDGAVLAFANDASGAPNLYRKAATGAGSIDRLTTSPLTQQPLDWSGDRRFLLFTQITPHSSEVMVQPASGGQALSLLTNSFGATHAQFNPGVPRWVAYDFDDTGRREVYVQAFEPGKPSPAARWQISTAGGTMPRWGGDGKEIFYLALDGKMMAAQVSGDGPSFQSFAPEVLFEATPPVPRTPSFEYDVAPDGQRFLMIEPAQKAEYLPLTLVTDWLSK